MKQISKMAPVFGLGVFLSFACSSCRPLGIDRAKLIDAHHDAVAASLPNFPIASELAKEFEVVNSLEGFFSEEGPKAWVTFFILEDRYEVIYRRPAKYSDAESQFFPDGAPRMVVNEIREVGPGGVRTKYGGVKLDLDPEQITAIRVSGWDFSKVGVPLGRPGIPNVQEHFEGHRSGFAH